MIVGKEVTFEAAHRLTEWPDSKCFNLHGHSWLCEVQLYGLPDRGYVVDFYEVGKMLKLCVYDRFDHRYLNDALSTNMPTCEYLVMDVWKKCMDHMFESQVFAGVQLYRVKIWETVSAYAQYGGE